MAEEISRQLVNGEWKTIAAAAGGGGAALPTGGTTAQVLAKASDADQDVEWLTVSGAASTPVACWLRTGADSVADAGQHDALWAILEDNPWDSNALGAIPAGLGLTFAFDGSSATITTTDDGVWALSFNVDVQADATFAGALNDSLSCQVPIVRTVAGGQFKAVMSRTYALPAGAYFPPRIDTLAAATGNPLASVGLLIVRLA